MFEIETKYGDINLSPSIINRIAEEAVAQCDGKVILHNYKGRYMEMVPGIASKISLYDEKSGSIEMNEFEDGYELKIYVVIKFGSSIKKMTTCIIDSIYDNTEKILGKKPSKVTVSVTGILSKNIAKRHIEVSR